jgi:hypothetical protein
MDPERTQKLEEIGFDFNPMDKANEIGFDFNFIKKPINKANEILWNSKFQKLREYYEKHGHCELFWAVDCFIFILNTVPPLTFHLWLSLDCR